MQIIHGNGFNSEEILAYRTQIYENMMRGMAGLVNGKKELTLPWRGSFSTLRLSAGNDDDDASQQSELVLRMKSILNQFVAIYKRLMDDREKESLRLNKRLNIMSEEFSQSGIVGLIFEIWNDHSIREAYDRRREFPKYFVENVPYFIDNIDRIGQKVNKCLLSNRVRFGLVWQ